MSLFLFPRNFLRGEISKTIADCRWSSTSSLTSILSQSQSNSASNTQLSNDMYSIYRSYLCYLGLLTGRMHARTEIFQSSDITKSFQTPRKPKTTGGEQSAGEISSPRLETWRRLCSTRFESYCDEEMGKTP